MRSQLFEQGNHEVQGDQRFALQNGQLLRAVLGPDLLAVKGAMVAYQGSITFEHESAGMGRLIKKVLTQEDLPLMRVSGQGEVFFAAEAGYVYIVDLQGQGLSVNSRSLLAFDAELTWDIKRVQGAGVFSGGFFNTHVEGQGQVAIVSVGQPVVLDCSQQPTFVDIQATVAWSASLTPQLKRSTSMRSLMRGGSGEAFQYAFHGPGFVVVQPSEWSPPSDGGTQSNRGGLGDTIGNVFGN